MRPAHLMAFAQKPALQANDDLTFSVLACQCAGCSAHRAEKTADSVNAAISDFHAAFAASNHIPSEIAAAPSQSIVDVIEVDGDTDSFTFNLVAGQTYTFSVRGTGADPLTDPLISLLNPGGTLLVTDDDGGTGTNSLITYVATATGAYTLVVGSFDNGANDTGEYVIDFIEKPAADEAPDTFDGAIALSENGVYFGFIDSPAQGPVYQGLTEVDTFKIEVEAGKFYTIEMAGGYPGNTSTDLDTVLLIYDSEGNQVTVNDDISSTDFSSRAGFFAATSGTYYIDAAAYVGDSGGYILTTREVDPAGLDVLDSIRWKSADNIDIGENNTVKVYFGQSGESFGEDRPSYGWNATEKAAVFNALGEYTKVIGITYVETTNVAEAEFKLITTTLLAGESFGAYFYPQDPDFGTQQGIGAFNVNSGGWDKLGVSTQNIPGDQVSLLQGGFSFGTILHEFGHAHGLAHPHDNGGGSDILLGVTASTGSYGAYDLNQGIYTVMSYNDAWDFHPDGPSPFTIAGISNGWSGSLSAFDIAVLQERYGAAAHATGNTVYALKDVQAIGTYYETIWDTGGTDEIRYDGNRNAVIDLLAATLDYSPTGGGAMSFVDDIKGGYTIAGGVVIENASGGGGDDALLGNAAANTLNGNDGDDVLIGRGGGDRLNGGNGNDIASYATATAGVIASLTTNVGSAGDATGDRYTSVEGLTGSNFADRLDGSKNADTLSGLAGDDRLDGANGDDALDGGAGNDLLYGGNGADTLLGGDGNDEMEGGAGDDAMEGGAGADRLKGGADNDSLDGGDGNDILYGENGSDALNGGDGDDFLGGDAGDDALNGGAGNDRIQGGKGNDLINGGEGDDQLYGGDGFGGNDGNDVFAFSADSGNDRIIDFKRGQDQVDVSDIADFGWVGSGAFSGGGAASLRSYSQGGAFLVAGDVDGDGLADFTIQVNVQLQQSDIIFA